MSDKQADFERKTAEARLKRNMVTLNGTPTPWWEVFPRLSNKGMQQVRERRTA